MAVEWTINRITGQTSFNALEFECSVFTLGLDVISKVQILPSLLMLSETLLNNTQSNPIGCSADYKLQNEERSEVQKLY